MSNSSHIQMGMSVGLVRVHSTVRKKVKISLKCSVQKSYLHIEVGFAQINSVLAGYVVSVEVQLLLRVSIINILSIYTYCLKVKGIGGSQVKFSISFVLTYVVALSLQFPKWAHFPSSSARLPRYECKREAWCRENYRNSYTLKKQPNFPRCPIFWATR